MARKYPLGWVKLSFSLAVLCNLFVYSEFTYSQEAIQLNFNVRPPFMIKHEDGTVAGSSATPAINAFERAKIPYKLNEASPARQLKDLKDNEIQVCSIGWYKTIEREHFAKFTAPISQDTPMIGLANSAFNPGKTPTLDDVLGNKNTRILIKKSIVYGPFLEKKFSSMNAQKLGTYAEFSQMFKMITMGRADLTFIPHEEATYYLSFAGYKESDFRVIQFSKMPPGEKRYLMCSMKVSDDTIQRLNDALPNYK